MTFEIGNEVRILFGQFKGETGTVLQLPENGDQFIIGIDNGQRHVECVESSLELLPEPPAHDAVEPDVEMARSVPSSRGGVLTGLINVREELNSERGKLELRAMRLTFRIAALDTAIADYRDSKLPKAAQPTPTDVRKDEVE